MPIPSDSHPDAARMKMLQQAKLKIIGTALDDIPLGSLSPMDVHRSDGVFKVEDGTGRKGYINTNTQLMSYPPRYEIEWEDHKRDSIDKRQFDHDVSRWKEGKQPDSGEDLQKWVKDSLSGKYEKPYKEISPDTYGKEKPGSRATPPLSGDSDFAPAEQSNPTGFQPGKETKTQALKDLLDSTHDGKVSRQEFDAAMATNDGKTKLLQLLDKNDDGVVTKEEAANALNEAGIRLKGKALENAEASALALGRALDAAGVAFTSVKGQEGRVAIVPGAQKAKGFESP
jgi:hypothetical protein